MCVCCGRCTIILLMGFHSSPGHMKAVYRMSLCIPIHANSKRTTCACCRIGQTTNYTARLYGVSKVLILVEIVFTVVDTFLAVILMHHTKYLLHNCGLYNYFVLLKSWKCEMFTLIDFDPTGWQDVSILTQPSLIFTEFHSAAHYSVTRPTFVLARLSV